MAQKYIYVYADWIGIDGPALMGLLKVEEVRGTEVFSFEYDHKWLKDQKSHLLDPDMGWYKGAQYQNIDKRNFGLFLDSSPDRWGQLLMKRREALLAKNERRRQRILQPSDFLLGVFDGHRMGALRFKDSESGPFLNDNKELATPPWTSLKALEYASLQIEKDDVIDNPQYLSWLNMLIAPGTSLGGARPKAGILDKNNKLWIAKFPSGADDIDAGAWEMVAHDLAINAGINMSDSMLMQFTGRDHTFLTKRFDRTESMQRIHFASAMTLLGRNDGDSYRDGASYLELAGFILQNGDMNYVNKDLEELWRRIVFSICIKNTDDHLRNHGFLLGENGWRLSPVYDINPIPTGAGLTLNISDTDNSLNLELVMEVAEYFRIDNAKATKIINQVTQSVSEWRKIARKYSIPKTEQELMSGAFTYV